MNTKRRAIALMLAAAMILSGCSSEKDTEADITTTTTAATTPAETTAAAETTVKEETTTAEKNVVTETTSDDETTAASETATAEATTVSEITTTEKTASEEITTTEAVTTAEETTAAKTTTAKAETTTAIETTVTEETITETEKAEIDVNIPDESGNYSAVMEQYVQKAEELEQFMKKTAELKTMPVIHITTLDEKEILSKEEYNESVIDVFNCGEEYRLTAEGGVRVRGNSTADGEEKPYRIKFNEKQGMLGLHEGMAFKSWVLLRSQWNLIPDYTGFMLARTIFDGKYYCSDSTYVNVYVNGKYKGLYLLCEQNQAAKGRVEVYEPSVDEGHTDIGYFIELDNYAEEEDNPYFTMDLSHIRFTDYENKTQELPVDDYTIKSDTTNEAQVEFAEKYLTGVFKILHSAVENKMPMMFDEDYNVVSAQGVYSTPKEAVDAVMDLQSVVDTMILQELVHNYDVGAGSFFMAVDFSENSKYKKLTFLAPWDFNWAYSEETAGRYYAGAFQKPVHDMHDRSNAWLTVIMKADWFREMLKDKWAELDNGQKLTDTLKIVLETAKSLEADLEGEFWRVNSAKDIIGFVRGRIKWLNGEWSR